jgi:hypothetical protein
MMTFFKKGLKKENKEGSRYIDLTKKYHFSGGALYSCLVPRSAPPNMHIFQLVQKPSSFTK